MTGQLETCDGCGCRGLPERIEEHECVLSDDGVGAYANSQAQLRLVGEESGEWIRMDGGSEYVDGVGQ